MKILVLTGSPRKNGNSNILANNFVQGAQEAGHDVVRFDTSAMHIHPCTACDSCSKHGICIFKDDFVQIQDHIIDADMIAFITPMYYFGMSAQLKAALDRFFAIDGKIHGNKKAIFMMTSENTNPETAKPSIDQYKAILQYLDWTDAGIIIAQGVGNAGEVSKTAFPARAYNLGKNL